MTAQIPHAPSPSLPIDQVFGDDLDMMIQRLMAEWDVPGLAIAAPFKSDHQAILKTYGTAYKDQTVSSQTRFPICSITKLFTALTLLRLLDGHGLSPDTPIRAVLPRSSLQSEGTSPVTFAHAIGHTAGVQTSDLMYTDPTAQADLVGYLATLPCSASPGSTPIFSNYMFDIAALAIEALAKRPFAQEFKEDIFDPLGMCDTSFEGVAGEYVAMGRCGELDIGTGPEEGIQSLSRYKMATGSYGLISTAADMAKWATSLSTNPFLASAAYPRIGMSTAHHPGGSLHDAPLTYGMGCFQGSHANTPFYEVFGATAGYRSNMAIIPSLGVSVVVMANSEKAGELGTMIKFWAIRRALGLDVEPVINAMRIEHNRQAPAPPLPLPSTQHPQLLGTYLGPGLGQWHFTPASYRSVLPKCTTIPYLPWLYGACVPILTAVGDGAYEGCLEWTNKDGRAYYEYAFRMTVRDGGEVRVSGADWGVGCVLRKAE